MLTPDENRRLEEIERRLTYAEKEGLTYLRLRLDQAERALASIAKKLDDALIEAFGLKGDGGDQENPPSP